MPEVHATGPSSPSAAAAAAVEESTAAAPPPPKRRKLRKGTVSCRECKRRKTRCTYAAPAAAVCDGCRSRQTPCTSQAIGDEPPPAAGRTTARLGRVEALVEQLAKQRGVDAPPPPPPPPSTQPGRAALTDPEGPDAGPGAARARLGGAADDDLDAADNLDAVSEALLAVWPDEHDMDLILDVPSSLAIMTHGVACAPHARVVSSATADGDDDDDDDNDEAWSPRRLPLRRRPPRGTHPVLIARRLLLLATLLQGVPEAVADAQLGGGRLHIDHRRHQARCVGAAARLVTGDDGLAGGSLDGLECVLLEAMYRNNEGRLRRAWLATRRALALAQLWRLPAHATTAPPPALAPDTRARVDPAYLWFRLVCTDRYLSLVLGLPQAVPGAAADAAFAAPAALAACASPLERLERLCAVACGLVLERNRAAAPADAAATRRVDALLRDAAAQLPPAWWCEMPDAAALAGADARRALAESLRVMAHLALRHILVQLHLPYLLSPPAAPGGHDYSRMVATNACRAVVAQFVAFRALVPGTAYCRGVDFVAFIASTVLCLAHIEAHRLQHHDDDDDGGDGHPRGGAPGGATAATAFQSLAHQRPGDRDLLDRALACLGARDDAIARRAGGILRPLLVIEEHAAGGGARYCARASEEPPLPPPPGAPVDPAGADEEAAAAAPDWLRIEIPYFGTVRVERRRPAAAPVPGPDHPENHASHPQPEPVPPALPPTVPVPPGELADWELGMFGALGNPAQAPFPDYPVDDENAWALQGVDMALFTNLSYDSTCLGDTGPRG